MACVEGSAPKHGRSGYVIIIVLYILLAIILGSAITC